MRTQLWRRWSRTPSHARSSECFQHPPWRHSSAIVLMECSSKLTELPSLYPRHPATHIMLACRMTDQAAHTVPPLQLHEAIWSCAMIERDHVFRTCPVLTLATERFAREWLQYVNSHSTSAARGTERSPEDQGCPPSRGLFRSGHRTCPFSQTNRNERAHSWARQTHWRRQEQWLEDVRPSFMN